VNPTRVLILDRLHAGAVAAAAVVAASLRNEAGVACVIVLIINVQGVGAAWTGAGTGREATAPTTKR
jgi:hypothetical protein